MPSMVLCNDTCEMSLPYLTCSLRMVLLFLTNQWSCCSFLINSVGPKIAKKLLRLKKPHISIDDDSDFEVLSRQTEVR